MHSSAHDNSLPDYLLITTRNVYYVTCYLIWKFIFCGYKNTDDGIILSSTLLIGYF